MLGVDEFELPPSGNIRIRVRLSGSPPNADQLAVGRRALLALGEGMGGNEPRMLALAAQIGAALQGELLGSGGHGVVRPSAFGPPRLGAGGRRALQASQTRLVRLLEEAILMGRLVAVEVKREALTEPLERVVESLPPRKGPRETAETFFEVRFVDETGQAINGVTVEIVTSEPNEVTTNAAGVALLEHVNASSASVRVAETSELETVLDARWVKPRAGSVRRESNMTELLFLGGAIQALPIKAAVPNTIVLKPPLGCLFVELWDKAGRVLHRESKYRIQGPSSFSGTTDEQGQLRHDAVFPGNYELELEVEFFDGKEKQSDKYKSPLVVLQPAASTPQIRMLGAVPYSVLVRLHRSFNSNKAFLLPTALPNLRALRRLYLENSPAKLLVVGHADTKGGPAFNDKLSLERARATIAYLKDDVDAWLAFYDESEAKKRWGRVEDHLMIIALPDYRSRPPGENEVEFFQRTRGLKVDGDAGPITRRALIAEYMSLDGASLRDAVGEIEAIAHGCGENFPLDDGGEGVDSAPEDNKRDPVDRRVELFFFDEEFGVLPSPPGSNSGPGSTAYPAWRAGVAQIVDLEPDDAEAFHTTFVELDDGHFRTNSAVVLPEGESPTQDESTGQAITAVGLFATVLRFNDEHPGRKLFVAGHADTTATIEFNQKLSNERAACAIALLMGDRAAFQVLCDARHTVGDVKQILAWASRALSDFDCDPGRIDENAPTAVEPIRRFQNAYNRNKANLGLDPLTTANLKPNGVVGPPTWGAIFDCYEFALREELGEEAAGLQALRDKLIFVDDQRRAVGFSEHFPIEELGVDNFRSQQNRRVEILFFESGEEPDLAHAESDPETSELYLPGSYVREAVDPVRTARRRTISIQFVDKAGVDLGAMDYRLEVDDGSVFEGFSPNATVQQRVAADARSAKLVVGETTIDVFIGAAS